MRRTRTLRAPEIGSAAVLAIAVVSVRPARAECVLPAPVCQHFDAADRVFLGDVAEVAWDD